MKTTFVWREGLQDSKGSAGVEYAMILGVIVTIFSVAAVFIGERTSSALRGIDSDALRATFNENGVGRSSAALNLELRDKPILLNSNLHDGNQYQLVLALAAAFIATICYAIKLRHGLINQQQLFNASVGLDKRHSTESSKKFRKRQLILDTLKHELPSFFSNEMEVRQLMTHPVKFASPTSRVSDVRNLMNQDDVRHYPVCDEAGKLIGILSDRDILANEARFVSQCMTTKVLTVRPDTKVSPAVTMMIEHKISSLPVVEQDELVGLITMTDIAMTLQCALQMLQNKQIELDVNRG